MTNRLGTEKSPYLLQHAHNPVDWYPWGDEAFQAARDRNVPIFLSIGYSTCHWCHVMERESFENGEIARFLNEHFVSIKVDREERPDVDSVYMTALTQVMGRHGGWPMSMFLSPALEPFFGGTYFPPGDREGMPGFKSILERVAEVWKTRSADVLADAKSVADAVREVTTAAPKESAGALKKEWFADAFKALAHRWDPIHGGMGHAPKFPQPSAIQYLLRLHRRTGAAEPLIAAQKQLAGMARGGIYDHLGGGFARYSTDEKWLVPHFEKMAYDNGQLLRIYAEAHALAPDPLYEHVLRETAAYVLRDLRHADGPFYSAEDADSEGVEGKFYVWRKSEVQEVLLNESAVGEKGLALFCSVYGVTDGGNWEDPHHDTRGLTVLSLVRLPAEAATEFGLDLPEAESLLNRARASLLRSRSKRVRPGLDDKVLTGWNALIITGLACAGQVLGEAAWIDAAAQAAEFLWTHLRDEQGDLLRRWRDGEAAGRGSLEDYAHFTEACVALHAATLDPRWMDRARVLHSRTVELFWDTEGAGFFFAEAGRADLIARAKDVDDGALPSPLAVATLNGLKLAEVYGVEEWRSQAEATLKAYSTYLAEHPLAVTGLLMVLDWFMGPVKEVVLAEPVESPRGSALKAHLDRAFLPHALVLSTAVEGSPLTEFRVPRQGQETAYVCEGQTCQAPVTDEAALQKLI